MADRLVKLHHFPASYYSQKVLIALQEKEVAFEPVIVQIQSGEQNQAPYMRINPKGEVPALQDGEKTITGSESIVDYIDREFPADSKLVPDMSTEIGKEVSKWRGKLDAVPIYLVTFGTIAHPDLSVSGLELPSAFKKKKTDMIAGLQIAIKKLEELADNHPDLREAYTDKIAVLQKRMSAISDKDKIVKVLDELEATVEEVEAQLKKVDADPSKELWLCGQQFTAADINLCIFLGRLDSLGLGARYFPAEKRPRLAAYWTAAKKRESVNRVTVNLMREMLKLKLKKGAQTVLPILGGLVTVGLAAGLAFIFTQKK